MVLSNTGIACAGDIGVATASMVVAVRLADIRQQAILVFMITPSGLGMQSG
jgi:hypothetical protein